MKHDEAVIAGEIDRRVLIGLLERIAQQPGQAFIYRRGRCVGIIIGHLQIELVYRIHSLRKDFAFQHQVAATDSCKIVFSKAEVVLKIAAVVRGGIDLKRIAALSQIKLAVTGGGGGVIRLEGHSYGKYFQSIRGIHRGGGKRKTEGDIKPACQPPYCLNFHSIIPFCRIRNPQGRLSPTRQPVGTHVS